MYFRLLSSLLVSICLLPAAATEGGGQPPAMGWSSYNFFLGAHDDALFRGMADAFAVNGLREAGYTIMRIDGGWWGNDSNRRAYYWTTSGTYQGGFAYQDGDPHVDPANYPQGLRGLADYMHGKSLKLGFYLSPALSLGGSANYPGNALPQTQPTLQGNALIDRHARVMADAGIDHLFYDGYDWSEDQGKEPYERMATSLAAESARVGRRIIFSINTAWKWRANAIADEWRTSRDINEHWENVMHNLATVTDPMPAGNGRWNNPDYLMAGFVGQTDEEARSQMSLWCVTAAPLYTSWDFRAMNSWERYVLLNTEAIAVNQELTTPSTRNRASGGIDVWRRNLNSGAVAAVLLNTGSSPAAITVTWSELGLPGGQARVRDLWTHADAGTFSDSYTASAVPAHGCAMIVVKSGTALIAPLATGYAPHPGVRPSATPVSTIGWTMPSGGGFANPTAAFDGNPATTIAAYAYPGTSFEIALPVARTLNRLLIDEKGAGANPWPLTIYAPRTTYKLEVSSNSGGTWTQVASGSMGPAYTPIDFPRTSLNRLRFTFVVPEITTAYVNSARPTIGDIYAFDNTTSTLLGDVNGDGRVDNADVLAVTAAFGTRSGEAQWNSLYDCNHDGLVNALDLGIVGRNQGQ